MDGKAPKKRCPGDSPFCLGLPEWDCCGTQGLLEGKMPQPLSRLLNTNGPTAKAPKMSLQLHKQKKKVLSPSSRFNKTVSTEEIDKALKGCIPKNTAHATSWAVRAFK